ncbi:hypothetical protein UA08_04575 [Talaromyces atroroseus]|uniref:superoxide dismutase n=1 Tax=Talaromyces atroroseus TaxID=1441469 RepID=A0A225AYZ1_TALAT|nr:hypothetical protein UA08_04575 [Talaromyces atroroseus]OKL60186.1 hypothetical protein UA08_04575 [Talaromyces atroroseus]
MIYSALVILCLVLSSFGQRFVSAPVITDNVDAIYTATLLDRASSSIRGRVTASSGANGVGLSFDVSFTGLPAGLGPFPYHVHVSPVPGNGDCDAAGPHLDPYNRGEQPPCDASAPATCQIGDLSGKHGNATAPAFTAVYTDPYLSNNAQSNAFIGDRSIVIHSANGTRLNCGNFHLVSGNPSSSAKAGNPSISTRVPRGSTLTHLISPSASTHTSTSTRVTFTSTSTHVVPTSSSTHVVSTSTSTHIPTTTTTIRVPTTFTSRRATTTSISIRPGNFTTH